MILDEPTSGVDEGMSENIVEYLKELGKEKTIIYITHDAREIEKIGAYQAIDIDKQHSENGENVIKTFDLTDEDCRKNYIEFFLDRKKETDEELRQKELDLQREQEEKEEKEKQRQENQKKEKVEKELDKAYKMVKDKEVVDNGNQSEKEGKISTKQNSNNSQEMVSNGHTEGVSM